MSGLLKWDGLSLMLGKTKMAHLDSVGADTTYVLGPNDFTSEPYERTEDARQDCERHVRQLLKKAGVGDA